MSGSCQHCVKHCEWLLGFLPLQCTSVMTIAVNVSFIVLQPDTPKLPSNIWRFQHMHVCKRLDAKRLDTSYLLCWFYVTPEPLSSWAWSVLNWEDRAQRQRELTLGSVQCWSGGKIGPEREILVSFPLQLSACHRAVHAWQYSLLLQEDWAASLTLQSSDWTVLNVVYKVAKTNLVMAYIRGYIDNSTRLSSLSGC